MFGRDASKVSFLGVAMFLILAGATVLAVGIVMWLFNFFGTSVYSIPSEKIIGGLIIIGLGYIAMEIELIRTRK